MKINERYHQNISQFEKWRGKGSIPSTCGSPLQSFNELYTVRCNIDREQVCVIQYLCVYVSIKIQSILMTKELVPTNLELNIKAYIPPGPVLRQLDPALELSNFGCSSTHNHTLHVSQRTIGLCTSYQWPCIPRQLLMNFRYQEELSVSTGQLSTLP